MSTILRNFYERAQFEIQLRLIQRQVLTNSSVSSVSADSFEKKATQNLQALVKNVIQEFEKFRKNEYNHLTKSVIDFLKFSHSKDLATLTEADKTYLCGLIISKNEAFSDYFSILFLSTQHKAQDPCRNAYIYLFLKEISRFTDNQLDTFLYKIAKAFNYLDPQLKHMEVLINAKEAQIKVLDAKNKAREKADSLSIAVVKAKTMLPQIEEMIRDIEFWAEKIDADLQSPHFLRAYFEPLLENKEILFDNYKDFFKDPLAMMIFDALTQFFLLKGLESKQANEIVKNFSDYQNRFPAKEQELVQKITAMKKALEVAPQIERMLEQMKELELIFKEDIKSPHFLRAYFAPLFEDKVFKNEADLLNNSLGILVHEALTQFFLLKGIKSKQVYRIVKDFADYENRSLAKEQERAKKIIAMIQAPEAAPQIERMLKQMTEWKRIFNVDIKCPHFLRACFSFSFKCKVFKDEADLLNNPVAILVQNALTQFFLKETNEDEAFEIVNFADFKNRSYDKEQALFKKISDMTKALKEVPKIEKMIRDMEFWADKVNADLQSVDFLRAYFKPILANQVINNASDFFRDPFTIVICHALKKFFQSKSVDEMQVYKILNRFADYKNQSLENEKELVEKIADTKKMIEADPQVKEMLEYMDYFEVIFNEDIKSPYFLRVYFEPLFEGKVLDNEKDILKNPLSAMVFNSIKDFFSVRENEALALEIARNFANSQNLLPIEEKSALDKREEITRRINTFSVIKEMLTELKQWGNHMNEDIKSSVFLRAYFSPLFKGHAFNNKQDYLNSPLVRFVNYVLKKFFINTENLNESEASQIIERFAVYPNSLSDKEERVLEAIKAFKENINATLFESPEVSSVGGDFDTEEQNLSIDVDTTMLFAGGSFSFFLDPQYQSKQVNKNQDIEGREVKASNP